MAYYIKNWQKNIFAILGWDRKRIKTGENWKSSLSPFFILLALLTVFSFSYAAEVEVRPRGEGWALYVDQEPFYIKGVGCGLARGKKGEDYLKLARELGANTVRTWGIDQGTKRYLDTAHKYGLKVCAGIWINKATGITYSYVGDSQFKEKQRKEVLDYVKKFRRHPAILMWNVGNEALYFTKRKEEKLALARFLEELISQIHQLDPDHPVIYASAGYSQLPYLKNYVPSLDIVGANMYGSLRSFHGVWDDLDFTIPYAVTEYGPYLPTDRPKDINGLPIEMGDYSKAAVYKDLSFQVNDFKGFNLGGFVFHLGETTQESLTWWNINHGKLKKQAYWTIYENYTGQRPVIPAPRIKRLTVSKVKGLKRSEIIDVEVTVADEKEDLSYEYLASTAHLGVLKYYVNQIIKVKVIGKGNKVKIRVPSKAGVYRLYCFINDGQGNVACVNKTINVES